MAYQVIVYFQDTNSGNKDSVPGASVYINGTACSIGTAFSLSDSSLTLTFNLPASTGYTFYQWRYSLNGGSSASTSSNQSVSISPSQNTVVLIWCRIQGSSFTINYDYNYPDGSSGSSSSNFTYGRSFTLRSSLTKSGYYFYGWQIDQEIRAAGSAYLGQPNNITATAVWREGTPAQYSIFYFDNNSSGSTSSTTSLSAGSLVALKTPSSSSGYAFAGWEIDNVIYAAGSSYEMPAHDVRANGQWTGVEITIYFNLNNGNPGIQPMVVHSGEQFTLPSTIPTPTSSSRGTFTGWQINSSYYKAGETITVTSTSSSSTTLTATAQYSTATTVRITYQSQNTNYGTISGTTQVTRNVPGTYGTLPTVTALGNYVFAGWFDRSGYITSRPITSSTQIANYSNHTIYANFYFPFTLRFYPNNGSWEDGSTATYKELTFKYGDTFTEFPLVVRDGYESAIGWFNTSSMSGGVEYKEGDVCRYTGTSTSPTYVYARWPQKVTFNGNGGTPSSQTGYFAYGSQYSPLPSVTREGYSFLGWFTSSSGGTQVTTSSYVTSSTTRTLYAQWAFSSQTVTFNPNYSGGTTTTQTYPIPGTYSNFPVLTRDGYVFLGWFTSSGSSGTQVNNGDTVTNEATRTLYAHWEQLQEVTFNANGGYFSDPSETSLIQYYSKASGSTYSNFPTPTYANHSLLGWFTSSSGGTQVNEGDTVTSSNYRTLYAQWTVISTSVTIVFDANGGTFPGGTTTVSFPDQEIGDSITAPEEPTKSDARFDVYSNGFITLSAGDTLYITQYNFDQLVANPTFEAQWLAPIQVTFYANGGTFEGTGRSTFVFECNIGDSIEVPLVSREDPSLHYRFNGYYAPHSSTYFSPSANPLQLTINRSYYDLFAEYPEWTAEWEMVWYYTYTYYENSNSEPTVTVREYYDNEWFYQSSAPDAATRLGFEFLSWSPSLPADQTPVVSDRSFTALYRGEDVTLTFLDWDMSELSRGTYTYNSEALAPSVVQAANHRPGFTFAGWSKPYVQRGGAYYVIASETMEVVALYTGQTLTITFYDWDNTLLATKQVTYGNSLEDFPQNPTRTGYIFTGWSNPCIDVTTNLTTIAQYEKIPDSSSPSTAFGASPDDYIFVKPSTDYWQINQQSAGIGRGEPMPRRKATQKDHIISWEDPIYLNEWVAEIEYWFGLGRRENYDDTNASFFKPNPSDVPFAPDRNIVLERLIGSVLHYNYDPDWIIAYNASRPDPPLSIARTIFLYLWYKTQYYGSPPDWKRSVYKIQDFHTITKPYVSNTSMNTFMLYGAGYQQSPSEDIGTIVLNKTVHVASSTSPYAKAFVNNCMNGRNPLATGTPLRKKIIYTLYYILQAVADNIVFPISSTVKINSSSGARKTWDHYATKTLKTDEDYPGTTPKAEQYSIAKDNPDDPAWHDFNDGTPPDELGYHIVTTQPVIEATYVTNNNLNSGMFNIVETATTDTNKILASVAIADARNCSWTSQSGWSGFENIGYTWEQSPYSSVGTWELSYGRTAGKYFVYCDSGLNQSSTGDYYEKSEITFTIADSSVIRHHTKDGRVSPGVYMKPLKFYFLIKVEVVNFVRSRSGGENVPSGTYPYYPNPDVNEVLIDSGTKYVIVPWDAEYVSPNGNIDSSESGTSSIWRVSNVKGLIDTTLQAIDAKNIWDVYVRAVPKKFSDCKMPDITYPAIDNIRYDYNAAKHREFCSDNITASFTANMSLSIESISAAFLWSPRPSVGLPAVVDADVGVNPT